MEDRYEIRGKIGQGGLGAVYRGYDTRMNREVAIKRISTGESDPALQEESTRQLIKEAGALASLQHPHIVTVYDVGADEDGPYVVMELLSGKTLDELIENAPLTWPDFRELALQTQEALIAAHELDLIHSDIKPSNLMLTWLPSGKFQVKIVDFGLATLAQSQSKEELEELEAVFGSIFFMPPEQFERKPLDARSDIYSMGCVYYQALAGVYPFDGGTGVEVMNAHLQHAVKPLQEIRSDIPLWACDWIMWQINRHPQDRPESARESLSIFLQNDKNPNPTMSLGTAPDPNAPKRPRLIIPGSEPLPPAATAPIQPAAAPPGPLAPQANPVRLNSAALQATPAAIPSSLPPDPVDVQEPSKSKTAPQPLTPPEGSKPSVHTSAHELPEASAVPATVSMATVSAVPTAQVRVPAPTTLPKVAPVKRKLSNAAKGMIAAVMAIIVVLLAWYLIDLSGKNRKTARYNEIMKIAAPGDATEVPLNAIDVKDLLEAAAFTGAIENRQTIYKALFLAKATDGSDIDGIIADFSTTREMLPDVREVLIRDVLRKRKNPSIVPKLMGFAKTTQDTRAAVAALQAVRFMAGDEQFDAFVEVIQSTHQEDVRKAAEETLAEIIRKSSKREDLANRLATAYQGAVDDNIRHSLLRLSGRCGGPKALELVKAALADEDVKDKIAAIIALGTWGDNSGLGLLTDFMAGTSDEQLRGRAFEAALKFISDPSRTSDGAAAKPLWSQLSTQAKTRAEQEKIVRGLVNFDDDWALAMLEEYAKSTDDRIADLAGKGVDHVRERKRVKGDN